MDLMNTFGILAFLCVLGVVISDQDILGCGGFVKSEVEINFSLVEVALYTRQGSLKYQTDCAPHNGYYMVPVYDKGDYVLKVRPPPGWTFSPESVDLSIDGSTDLCSQGKDINFQFTGFGVVGQVVSVGHESGPTDVTLTLTKQGDKQPLKTTATTAGGAYTFENVLPGEYEVAASHPRWQFQVASTRVRVDRETGNAGTVIAVKGYDVTGRVFSEGEPIQGVSFILFSDSISPKAVSGCDQSEVAGFPRSLEMSPLCHTVSLADGGFSFPCLPPGQYKVVPFYKGDNIFFDVVPGELAFTVQHGSLKLQEAFDVAGFSVQGRVLNGAGGTGVAGARILLNGKEQALTRQDGTYHLDSMKAGSYHLEVKVNQMTFDPVQVKVTPNTPHLPDMIASKFSVCGRIIIDQVPEGLGSVSAQRQLSLTATSTKKASARNIASDEHGNFCTDVAPGTYSLQVLLSEEERSAGLKLAPTTKEITVTNAPINGITFSQFRARVSGTVTCLETCGVIQLSLSPLSRSEERRTTQANEVSKGAAFHFEDVMPGKYRVTLHQEEWCWQQKTLDIEVTDSDVKDVNFQQSGYILSCSLSHAIKLSFEHEEQSGVVGEFDLPKGLTKFCLAAPGLYSLRPRSCHQFEKDTYRYDTSLPAVLTLNAVRHLAEGVIVTSERHPDITVNLQSSLEGEAAVVLGPLLSDKEPPPPKKNASKPAEPKGPFTYAFSHWARTGESLTITASSSQLLFYPPSVTVTITGDGCPGQVAKLEGRQGVFIEGVVEPPLAGVQLTISAASDPDTAITTVETDEKGKCKVGPLHGDVEYTAAATKEGYVLTAVAGKLGHFQAFKLGQIAVHVTDDAGEPLQGVLLSLSGETQYRSNKLSQQDGTMTFGNLSPGKYFLRPMMKEYTFKPASQMVDVLEGSALELQVKATRVAYSCYGSVTSLNGEAEAGVVVEAVGRGAAPCGQLQEEGKSEADGTFRIRGLQPSCEYEVRLKEGDANQHIERATPKSKLVKVVDGDLSNVRIIAFRRMSQMDLSGNVITSAEFLPTLKVVFYRDLSQEDSLDAPTSKLRELHTVALGSTSFFYLPAVTIDNKNYMIRLESSLAKSAYDYTTPEVAFHANSTYKHVRLHFQPKAKSLDQELKPSSFLIVPLTALIILLTYNYQKVMPMLWQSSSSLQSLLSKPSGSSSGSHLEPAGPLHPDLIQGPESLAGRKRKLRKV